MRKLGELCIAALLVAYLALFMCALPDAIQSGTVPIYFIIGTSLITVILFILGKGGVKSDAKNKKHLRQHAFSRSRDGRNLPQTDRKA